MRRLSIALALLLAACTSEPPAILRPTPSPEPGVLDVVALLDLSGPRAPRGDPQRDALQLWQDLDRARGTPSVRTRLKVVDVAGSDAKLLIELRRAVEDDHADAVIVGVPVSFATSTFEEAVRAAAVPVLLTLPSPEPTARAIAGKWLFAVAPTPEQLARRVVAPRALSAVVVPEAKPLDPESVAFIAEQQRVAGADPAIVRIARDDPGLVARGLATWSRVHLAGAPRDWSSLVGALRTYARTPTYVLSWLCEPAELGDLRDLDIVWPAPTALGAVPGTGTRRDVVRTFTDRHGMPTALALGAYDAMIALAVAAQRSGGDDREGLRALLETTSFTGVASTYAFSVTRHASFAEEDIALYRWSGGAAVPDLRR